MMIRAIVSSSFFHMCYPRPSKFHIHHSANQIRLATNAKAKIVPMISAPDRFSISRQ